MFTWICPQCGREVPPAYTECPDCTKRPAGAGQPMAAPPPSVQLNPEPAAPVVAAAPPPPEIPPLAPPIEPARVQPAPFQQEMQEQPGGARVPVWLVTVLSTLAFVGVVAGVYWTVNYFHSPRHGRPSSTVESPAAKAGAPVNPIQKFIEVSAVRFLEDPKNKEKVLVKFVLTNHSDADFNNLAGNVTIWASTGGSEEDAEGTFAFTTALRGFESKELTEPLVGSKKIYELPDWQNMTNDVQITAPTS